MARVHDAHFTGLWVAQQARKEARAADHAYLTTPATRWQNGGNVSFHRTDAIGADGCRATVSTIQRPNPADCRTDAQPSPAVPSVAAVGAPHTLTFVLPMPPSVNQLYRSGSGDDTFQRYLVPEQRMFRRTVCAIVTASMSTKLGRLPPLAGRIELTVTLYFANRRRTDLDNRFKSVLDALAHADAYHDDSQIDRIIAERVIRSGDEECAVILREIAA